MVAVTETSMEIIHQWIVSTTYEILILSSFHLPITNIFNIIILIMYFTTSDMDDTNRLWTIMENIMQAAELL